MNETSREVKEVDLFGPTIHTISHELEYVDNYVVSKLVTLVWLRLKYIRVGVDRQM